MCRSDRESIEQCLNGHPEEYRELVRRHQATLLSYLAGRLGNREAAKDAAQETFVRAFFSLKKLERPEAFCPWLLGIAQRVAMEERRRQERLMAREGQVPTGAEQPGAASDPELERAVSRLPDPYREVVLLRYYGGWSCSEVAEKLDLKIGTVTKRLSRAYAMLRTSLGGHARDTSEVQS